MDLLRRIPAAAIRLPAIGERTNDSPAVPSGMAAQELRGMVLGPWLYLRARRKLRRGPAVRTPRGRAAGASAAPRRAERR